MNSNGRFIVFEGLDGSGKTTQMLEAAKMLCNAGYNCVTEFEPTDGEIGKLIRRALRKEINLGTETLALLFAADRSEHIKHIKSELERGNIVLCDRYVYSNMASQGTELDIEDIATYNDTNISSLMPSKVFFIDTSPEECINRIVKNREVSDLYERLDILKKVHENYMTSFKKEFGKATDVVMIDGEQDINEITKKIFSEIVASL